jgi:thiamine biosynthesis lipoprotein
MATLIRPRMGTWLAVTLPAEHAGEASRVFSRVGALERVMSRHDPASTLCRVNAHAGADGDDVAPLARTLAQARALAAATDGAFDPTVGPLLRLWEGAARRHREPAAGEVAEACARVGWHALDVAPRRVRLTRPGMSLALDAFAKGVALDHTARLVRARGFPALLNFGESSLLAVGRPRGRRWYVVLRDRRGGFAGTFTLRDRACSTSGVNGRRWSIGGRTIGHVVDPRTGRPLERDAQVTVLARSAAVAEALSTALLVLGPDALDTVTRPYGADACWLDRERLMATAWFPLRRA